MANGTLHRLIGRGPIGRAALCALALSWASCAPLAHAQQATPAPEALPGIPDIDYSLEGRQAEVPGTPTEGEPRPTRTAEPSVPRGEPRATPSPQAAVPRASEARPGTAPQRVAPSASPPEPSAETTAELPQGDVLASEPLSPEFDAPAPAAQTAADPLDVAQDEESGWSSILALLFGLALLGGAAWLLLHRRRPAAVSDADRLQEVPVVPTPPLARAPAAPATPPARRPEPAPKPMPIPVTAAAPTPIQPATPPLREAHPALRVKVQPAPRVAPAEAEPPPPAPPAAKPAPKPATAIQRFDAFGRPIREAQPQPRPVPKPSPPAPAPPKRPGIVRYNALGLPIRD